MRRGMEEGVKKRKEEKMSGGEGEEGKEEKMSGGEGEEVEEEEV